MTNMWGILCQIDKEKQYVGYAAYVYILVKEDDFKFWQNHISFFIYFLIS
jgi:hypothetical protein